MVYVTDGFFEDGNDGVMLQAHRKGVTADAVTPDNMASKKLRN